MLEKRLITAGERVLVAVSAGPDSLALLYVLGALHGVSAMPAFSLAAAYIDHGLRPAESGRERALVAAAARELGIPWRGGRVAAREYADRHGLSLEHAARELRYRQLRELATELTATSLAVAHQADDQAEELLLRLLRGTAREGLSGMAWSRLLVDAGSGSEEPGAGGGGGATGTFNGVDAAGAEPAALRPAGGGNGLRLIRPLLAVPKAEILSYLAERGIAHAEDSSNQDRRFLRNRVRLELLPWLAERFNPNIRETLRRTATVLRDEEELLGEQATAAYRQARKPGGDPVALDLVVFNAQPRALRRRLLEKALWELAVKPMTRQIEQLLQGAGKPGGGVIAHLAAGVTVRKQGQILLFERGTPGPRRRPARR